MNREIGSLDYFLRAGRLDSHKETSCSSQGPRSPHTGGRLFFAAPSSPGHIFPGLHPRYRYRRSRRRCRRATIVAFRRPAAMPILSEVVAATFEVSLVLLMLPLPLLLLLLLVVVVLLLLWCFLPGLEAVFFVVVLPLPLLLASWISLLESWIPVNLGHQRLHLEVLSAVPTEAAKRYLYFNRGRKP